MKNSVKAELDRLIAAEYASDLDAIRPILKYIRDSRSNAEGIRYFMEKMDIIGTAVREDDKEGLDKLYYYYDRYQSLIHGLIECLTAGNPDEKKFYEALWLFIENGPVILPEEDDRIFAWMFAWRDRKTPYFQMKEGMEMSNERFSEISKNMFSKIAKADYILRFPFDQKTQRSSQLLDLLDECETQEERCVLMVKILNLKDEMKSPVIEKMLEVRKLLEKEK